MNEESKGPATARRRSTKWRRVLKFLNTGVGLWVLGTPVVASSGALFAYLQSNLAEHRRRAAALERLDLEVEYRMSQFMVGLNEIFAGTTSTPRLKQGYSSSDIDTWFKSFVGVPASYRDLTMLPMFPENAQRSLASVMAELALYLPESDRAIIKDRIAAISGGLFFAGVDASDPMAIGSHVNEKLFLPRWRTSFYYMNCLPKSPFC